MQQLSRRAALQSGLIVAGLAAAAGAGVTACGTGRGGPAGAESNGTARPGATLRFGGIGSASAVTTDPHGSIPSESDWARFGALYDVLTMPNTDGTVSPWLATSWSSEPDGLTHRFELRTDAVFSDGRPVRPADVLFSLGRIAGKATENGGRVGTYDAAASRVEGPSTLVLVTSSPDFSLARTLAGQCFVVPEGTESFQTPVGSGPFVLTSLQGTTAALGRNDRWWGERPQVNGLEVRGFADPQALAAAVTSGEIDVAANVSYAAARTAQSTGRLTVVRRPGAASYPLCMRVDLPPFDRVEVRQAIKLAVDRQALVEQVLLGYGSPSNDAPFPADPSYPADRPAPARDLAGARTLLAQAGLADGFDTVIRTTPAYPSMVIAATLLAQQLGEVGIRAQVREDPPEVYWSQVYTIEPLYMGYTTDALPIQHWASAVLLGTAAYNETSWRRPEFDQAFLAATANPDAQARTAALRALQEQVADDGGYVMWGLGDAVDVTSPAVQGLPAASGFARYFLSGVRLTQ